MNICQEISVPGCFINFRGKNNKNAIQNETGSYALGLGEREGDGQIDKRWKSQRSVAAGERCSRMSDGRG